MRRIATLLFTLPLLGTPLLGAAALDTSKELLPASAGCPVTMQMDQEATGRLLLVGPNSEGSATKLHITFSNTGKLDVVELTLLAHGFAESRSYPLMQARLDTEAAALRTVHLHVRVQPNQDATADVLLKNLAGVSALELQMAVFADGSHWQATALTTCRAANQGTKRIAQAQ